MQDSDQQFWLIWFPCLLAASVIALLYVAARLGN